MASRQYIVCAFVLCAAGASTQQHSTQVPRSASLLYTVASDYAPLAWLQGADRFPRGARVFTKSSGPEAPLLPEFFATADPDVAFDAGSILLAGKRTSSDKWQIWRIALPHGNPEQLTHCVEDCVRPLFLPGDRFVYAERVNGAFTMKAAFLGGAAEPLQLTHGRGNFLPNYVLRDGRILFEAAFPSRNSSISELFTVYSDGSGVESYRCDHGRSRYSGTQLSSGDVVFSREGQLAHFTSALAQEVGSSAPNGSYAGDVVESSNGSWLVTWRGPREKYFSLQSWKPGGTSLRPAVIHANANIVQPRRVAARQVPNRHPSALHEWAYANTLCLNAYTSKNHFEQGSIASVRVYTRHADGTTHMLGTAPVENDGSFYLRVPGDRPLQLEVLDSLGNSLKREAGWYWLRAGEQRICVGCHAGPETAPENAVPAVLLKSIVAADFTHEDPTSAPPSNAGGH